MNIDIKRGLTKEQVQESRNKYGNNLLTPPPTTPWWKLYLEKFTDPIIVILLVATTVSLIFGIIHGDFTESIGIICAILIATGVGFYQEWDAQKKFDSMKSSKDYELVKVRRDGVVLEISKDQLVVGDVVILSAGDEIPADIEVFVATDLKVNESSMTGESVAVAKHPINYRYTGSGFAPNLVLRGTVIEQGLGEGIVVKVGDATEIGRTTQKAFEETKNKTPLEEKLHELAKKINIAAFSISGLMFIILNIVHWTNYPFTFTVDTLITILQFLMSAVVIIIVAVPEGLPLSVTLALAFSMKTMAKEHNLVKKMHACETIGAVNLIFTDKTGTLTQNSMSVVEKDVEPKNEEIFNIIGTINSTANWGEEDKVIGNPTECAILKNIGKENTAKIRSKYQTIECIPFSSAYKYMVTYSQKLFTNEKICVIKGAPEVIARIIGYDAYMPLVSKQQERGRRAITAATIDLAQGYKTIEQKLKEGKELENCTYIGTWFIEDPVREDVPGAITKCYNAGIDVVMMTGDNIKTGSEIANQAGFKDIWAVEAIDFFTAVDQGNSSREYPNVIARCTPIDKLDILKWAQAKGYVCAMTGDGVNDSPSLNHADVGIAMGSGTSVAKEASDIILLNDAFPSIVTGVKWGRSLFKNIKNFLFFQLSINVSACLIALFGPIVGVEMPFTVTQFLWINLVMDSLAAIALASEPADENVLKDLPRNREEFIINKPLAKAIFGFGIFVWALCTFVLWGNKHSISFLENITPSEFFAAYMVLNWWNMFNARVIGKNKSVFNGLFRNNKFWGTALAILVTTILIVQFGGEVFNTQPISIKEWIIIIAATSPVVIFREIYFLLFNKNK